MFSFCRASIALSVVTLAFSLAEEACGGESQNSRRPASADKSICITFDEVPVASGFAEVDRQALTDDILKALKKHDVKAAGFVVCSAIGDNYDLLGRWLNDGHVLGNLTMNHQDYHELGIENFFAEVVACQQELEPILAGFGQDKRYFRYPFLHYGNTVEKKRRMETFLADQNIVVAHATVIVEDYFYNLSLDKTFNPPDTAEMNRVGNEYLGHVLQQIQQAEALSQQVLKRQARQILVLRANRINAFVLDELLSALEERGYKFISLDQALQDELYSAKEAYFGWRGVSYLEMIMDSDPDLVPAE